MPSREGCRKIGPFSRKILLMPSRTKEFLIYFLYILKPLSILLIHYVGLKKLSRRLLFLLKGPILFAAFPDRYLISFTSIGSESLPPAETEVATLKVIPEVRFLALLKQSSPVKGQSDDGSDNAVPHRL